MPANIDINEAEYWDMIDKELEDLAEKKQNNYRKWNDKEKELLIKYYNKAPVRDLAKKLGRTIAAVRIQAQRLDIVER